MLGIDDGKFVPHKPGNVMVVGIVFRGGFWFEGIMHTCIAVDGFDATEKIADMIKQSPHYRQLRLVMLNGITFAGFNIVNIKTLNSETKLPVVALTRDMPDLKAIRDALENLPKSEERWKAVVDAGEIFEVATREETKVFMEFAGISESDARKIIRLTATRSSLPEPLRVAHLIASGLTSEKADLEKV